jgi:hypothetical protein
LSGDYGELKDGRLGKWISEQHVVS